MGKLFNHVDDTERRLVKNMISAGIPSSQVQTITHRSRDTIQSILKPRSRLCKKEAPAKLSSHDVAKILKVAACAGVCCGSTRAHAVVMPTSPAQVPIVCTSTGSDDQDCNDTVFLIVPWRLMLVWPSLSPAPAVSFTGAT